VEHAISDVVFSGRPEWENPWEMRFSGERWAQAGLRQLPPINHSALGC
jgi:hypothetical protein